MNPEILIRTALLADATVTGLVGTRIAVDHLPQGSTFPGIVLQVVDGVPQRALAPVGSVVAVDARIQVNPVATTLASVKAIHAAVDAALGALNNTTVGGKRIVHCVWALLGPADHDIETGLWTQPVDFSLRWLH